jgi:hypothetical protein
VPPLPALVGILLMIVWTYHDGGYDTDTWYWGALVIVALVAIVVSAPRAKPLARPVKVALVA